MPEGLLEKIRQDRGINDDLVDEMMTVLLTDQLYKILDASEKELVEFAGKGKELLTNEAKKALDAVSVLRDNLYSENREKTERYKKNALVTSGLIASIVSIGETLPEGQKLPIALDEALWRIPGYEGEEEIVKTQRIVNEIEKVIAHIGLKDKVEILVAGAANLAAELAEREDFTPGNMVILTTLQNQGSFDVLRKEKEKPLIGIMRIMNAEKLFGTIATGEERVKLGEALNLEVVNLIAIQLDLKMGKIGAMKATLVEGTYAKNIGNIAVIYNRDARLIMLNVTMEKMDIEKFKRERQNELKALQAL